MGKPIQATLDFRNCRDIRLPIEVVRPDYRNLAQVRQNRLDLVSEVVDVKLEVLDKRRT